jgi:uncharacterized coiled-coil protein SlyX
MFAKEIEKLNKCVDESRTILINLNTKLSQLVDKLENSIQQYGKDK